MGRDGLIGEGVQVELFDFARAPSSFFCDEIFEIGVICGGRAGAEGLIRHGGGMVLCLEV